jgi:uncharacterized protein YndB with AHSA1/START domain
MITIELSTEIKRPVEEVWTYATDPEKVPEWNSLVLENRASPPGPLRKGSKIQTTVKFLGRRFESTAEVTEYEANKKFTLKGNSPFPLEQTQIFEAVPGGTRISSVAVAEPGAFFKLAEPILGRIAKKQFQAQNETMKEILEARVPAKVGS